MLFPISPYSPFLISSSSFSFLIFLFRLKPDRLFSDGMVLQQGQVVSVWGLADPGAPVAVTMQGQTAHARAAPLLCAVRSA